MHRRPHSRKSNHVSNDQRDNPFGNRAITVIWDLREAASHAGVSPDLMCLGKAFAHLFPMGATLASERVFDAFRGDKSRALHYGHKLDLYEIVKLDENDYEERLVRSIEPTLWPGLRGVHTYGACDGFEAVDGQIPF